VRTCNLPLVAVTEFDARVDSTQTMGDGLEANLTKGIFHVDVRGEEERPPRLRGGGGGCASVQVRTV